MNTTLDNVTVMRGTYTGRIGTDHMIAMEMGKDFLTLMTNDGRIFAIEDNPNNQSFFGFVLRNTQDICEWTRVRAFHVHDARAHAVAAHNQWHDQTNGLEDWIDSAVKGIRT